MEENEQILDLILNKISDEINISHTMRQKATDSYQAVGEWLSNGIYGGVKIMPQGSMNLGTVIRPISDADDEYDMDLVCLLKNGTSIKPRIIKNLVGDRLKESGLYAPKLDPEGKRCWTLNYDGFHMDILPCVPLNATFQEPNDTAIKLTHKNNATDYIVKYSNPYQYGLWFKKCMAKRKDVRKRIYALDEKSEIDEVPVYRRRTPLQKVIQLLKRHRDIYFCQNDKNAPISIIITTLAAQSYDGESNLYECMCNILNKMPQYISHNTIDGYVIKNPTMPAENFADKWNLEPAKSKAFFHWISIAKKNIIEEPLQCFDGLQKVAGKLCESLGTAPVTRAMKAIGDDMHQARKNDSLYINGLVGGLSLSDKVDYVPVKDHTFYGK